MECEDFSLFQDALKNLRKLDDMIVTTINSVLPTDSFHPDGTTTCRDLYTKLEDGNTNRERFIKDCITITTDRVKDLKEKKESTPIQPDVSKSLRAEQTKLKMLKVELSVEELIRQRSMKVFNEKCRKYMKS